MANMTYCRFRNTLKDLQDCYDAISNDDDLSEEEEKARNKIIELCKDMVEAFGD